MRDSYLVASAEEVGLGVRIFWWSESSASTSRGTEKSERTAFCFSLLSLAWKNSLCVRMAGLKNRVQSSWRVENFPSSLTPKLLALIYVRVCVCVFCFRELSNLRKREDYYTNCFAEVQRCWCVQGRYPTRLISLWKEYDQTKGT